MAGQGDSQQRGMAMPGCSEIGADGADGNGSVQCHSGYLDQGKKGFLLVEEAQKSGILIPKSCPAPCAPEKYCPILCSVPPSGKGRTFSSISGFSLDTGESRSWSEG